MGFHAVTPLLAFVRQLLSENGWTFGGQKLWGRSLCRRLQDFEMKTYDVWFGFITLVVSDYIWVKMAEIRNYEAGDYEAVCRILKWKHYMWFGFYNGCCCRLLQIISEWKWLRSGTMRQGTMKLCAGFSRRECTRTGGRLTGLILKMLVQVLNQSALLCYCDSGRTWLPVSNWWPAYRSYS